MAFPFKKLKEVYNKPGILDNPACDREVDFEMMKAGMKVDYLADAYILDEKVATAHVYENQRRRWLESQLKHLKLFFSGKENVRNKTKDFWNKLFINLIPPRLLFIAAFIFLFIVCLFEVIFNLNITGISIFVWTILFFLYLFSLLLAIPRRFLNFRSIKALLHLPFIFFSFFKAVITVHPNRKEFAHTPKTYTGNSGTTDK
jgi:cellulose synthase/poly-beta-1,6-N-acetylglucosamine synthase-like glycosyltransferase